MDALSIILNHRLQYNRECMIYFGPHNLSATTISSIFKSEHDSEVLIPKTHTGLSHDDKTRILEVLSSVCSRISADKAVIWDCFDKLGNMLPTQLDTPGPSSNEESLAARWSSRSLRM